MLPKTEIGGQRCSLDKKNTLPVYYRRSLYVQNEYVESFFSINWIEENMNAVWIKVFCEAGEKNVGERKHIEKMIFLNEQDITG